MLAYYAPSLPPWSDRECESNGELSQLAWNDEVMAGDTVERPARQEIDARKHTDHTHLHLLMTLSFWLLSQSK